MKFQGLSSLSFFTYRDVFGLKNVKIGPFGIFVPFWTLGVKDIQIENLDITRISPNLFPDESNEDFTLESS